MNNIMRKELSLSEEATKILHRAGFTWAGRRWSDLLPPGERVRLFPNGGFSGRSTRKPPRTIRVYFGG